MSELKKEELLNWLEQAHRYFTFEPPGKDEQAFQQIKQIIKLHFSDDWQQVKKDLGKFMQEQKLGKKKGLMGMAGEIFNEAHKKPEGTEEWIEEKAIKMGKIVVAFHAPGSSVRWMGNPHERCKDFIRSLIKEIK